MKFVNPVFALFLSIALAFIGRNSLLFFGEDEIGYTNFYMLMEAISGLLLFISIKSLSQYLRLHKKFTELGADIGICGCVVEVIDELMGNPTWFQWHEYLIVVIIAGIIGWRLSENND